MNTPSNLDAAGRETRSEPRRFARLAVGACMALVLLLSACELTSLTADQSVAVELLNRDRVGARVGRLQPQPDLGPAAQRWAGHLAATESLSHHSSWAPKCATSWAENVGYGPSLAKVEAGFMASTVHRRNLVNPRYTKVFVAVVAHDGRFWVVQRFTKGC